MTQEESKVYAALQTFNNGIKSNGDAKTLIVNLGTDLSKIKPNDKNFKESLDEISEKLGKCEKNFGKYKTTYKLSNEKTPHYEIFKTVSSDKITQTVEDNLKNKKISDIASQKNAFFNVEFPKRGKIDGKNTDEKLEKELAKFVVNLLRKLYPELAPTRKAKPARMARKAGATKVNKNNTKKAIRKDFNKKPKIEKSENENPSNENSLIRALNDFSSGVLNTVISNGQSDRSINEVLSSCVSLVDKLFNNTANYEKENSDVKSVIEKIREASEEFLKQKDVYKGRISQSASIPTLYGKLTGKKVNADDIALAKEGEIEDNINEIKGLDNGSNFYKPVRKCLSAFMCIYAFRDREEFFKELYDSSSQESLGEGGWGEVIAVNKRGNGKQKAVKKFHKEGSVAFAIESAHEVNAALESDLDKIHQIKHSAESKGKNHKEKEEYKKAKGNVNRIALSKVVGGKLVSKRAECDLLKFIEEKFPHIILDGVKKINDSNIGDTEKKEKIGEHVRNVKDGFTQLIKDMKTAVEQFHKAKMCHRDIKPQNFLVFRSKSRKSLLGYKCKLSDLDTKLNFGDKFEYKFSGTPYYTPPGFCSQTGYELMGSLCVEFGKGKAGCEVGRMLDLYALYKSMWQIARCIEEYSIGRLASELAAIADREANALYRDCKEFEMFDSLENMKKFLIDNGSNEEKDMDEYIGYYSHSYLEEDGTDNNKPNGNGAGNILKSRPNENGAGNIFKSRPNGNGAGNIFKSRPNGNAAGNIFKSRPNGNGAGNILKSKPNENGAGNIFKSRPNENAGGNIFKLGPNGNSAQNIFKSRPPKSDD